MGNKAKQLSYGSFTLEAVKQRFKLTLLLEAIFPEVAPVTPSELLRSSLQRASSLALLSEKARAEFIVAPILLEVREQLHETISIYSGVRFDVSPEEGLQGVCDFLVTKSPPLPAVQTPVIVLVEAKKNDLEEGLGQCAAEMIAAQRVNQRDNILDLPVYGCVTTGELWQFLKLADTHLVIEPEKLYIEALDKILGMLVRMAA